MSKALIEISTKLIIKIKNVKLEKKTAIKKVNQSVVILVLTVMFFTYAATKQIIKQQIELKPKGIPMTTSFNKPARNMWPFPINPGLFKEQK